MSFAAIQVPAARTAGGYPTPPFFHFQALTGALGCGPLRPSTSSAAISSRYKKDSGKLPGPVYIFEDSWKRVVPTNDSAKTRRRGKCSISRAVPT